MEACDFEETLALVQPADERSKFTGVRFAVSGIPLSWSAGNVSSFFAAKWDMKPLFAHRKGFTREWIVQAAAPPISTRWQHELGLATVREARAVKQPANNNAARKVWTGAHKDPWKAPQKLPMQQPKAAPAAAPATTCGSEVGQGKDVEMATGQAVPTTTCEPPPAQAPLVASTWQPWSA